MIFCRFRHLPTPVESQPQEENVEFYRNGKRALNIEIWFCRRAPLYWACQLQDFWNFGGIPHSCLRVLFIVREIPPARAWRASLHRSRKYGLKVVGGATKEGEFVRRSWSLVQHRWLWVESVHHPGDDGVHYRSLPELPRVGTTIFTSKKLREREFQSFHSVNFSENT